MAEWAVTFHASFVEGENLKTFKADFTDNDRLTCSFGDVIQVDPHPVPEPYPGPYEVIPGAGDQILETKNRNMTNNVTVRGIGQISYPTLADKPAIEGNVLIGDKTFKQLGLDEITPQEIDDLFDELIYGG